jgi:hypothetical protein
MLFYSCLELWATWRECWAVPSHVICCACHVLSYWQHGLCVFGCTWACDMLFYSCLERMLYITARSLQQFEHCLYVEHARITQAKIDYFTQRETFLKPHPRVYKIIFIFIYFSF